jgi:hypothetical protein
VGRERDEEGREAEGGGGGEPMVGAPLRLGISPLPYSHSLLLPLEMEKWFSKTYFIARPSKKPALAFLL